MLALRPFAVCLLALCAACGARLRSFDDVESTPNATLEHGAQVAAETHGHRDFPRGFDEVWSATVEALHVRGVPVPQSATPRNEVGEIDLDSLFVRVAARMPGRVCVELHFRQLDDEAGQAQASALLDEIQARL